MGKDPRQLSLFDRENPEVRNMRTYERVRFCPYCNLPVEGGKESTSHPGMLGHEECIRKYEEYAE